jgi:V/A-type H+-transporting ATPase subunit I
MSIVPLVKVTVCGRLADKASILLDLQEIGCLHLIPLNPEHAALGEGGPSPESREALKFLLSCPQQRRQMRDSSAFDGEEVQKQALQIRDRLQELEDERDFLRKRIRDLEPWGDFRFPPLSERHNQRLWFYIVPHYQMNAVEASDLVWQVVGRDNRFTFVAVISENEPEGMPVPRTHTGSKPLSELQARLDEVESAMEDLQAERAALTRWCTLFAAGLGRLEDHAAFLDAFLQTYEQSPLFALQGWAPRERVHELQAYAAKAQLALEIAEPTRDEEPPTFLRNEEKMAPGEDLVTFYMTPGYWIWDPSPVVLLSFALFFAMIISDAGYALVMAAGLAMGWQSMGHSRTGQRVRLMFSFLIGASVVWGILAGSYFGISPPEGSWLAALHVFDLRDASSMMALTIMIGVAHIGFANAVDVWRHRSSSAALAPAGWIAMLLGAVALAFGASETGSQAMKNVGIGTLGTGAALVLLFTGVGATAGSRFLQGLQGLWRITNAFGDVLSYLRLFALGLASASLAIAFNDLAMQVADSVPGLGILLAGLVLLIGHTLNFVLAIVSGFVHGLRLNVIEFFNWSMKEEGRPFRAFEKKEVAQWTR